MSQKSKANQNLEEAPLSKKVKMNEETVGAGTSKDKHCLICNIDKEDNILHGPIMSLHGIRCHYFCLLLTYGLEQNGCEIKDMAGFKTEDIIASTDYIKKQNWKCTYCKKPNPASVCHVKSCKKRFHLPCGMENNALMHFFGAFETFCHVHAKDMIVHEEKPGENEECSICYDDLGEYNPVSCFRPSCCIRQVKEKEEKKAYWMHYRCAMQGARNLGYYFNCFAYSCGKRDDAAKQGYLDCGIFIPNRDALYENGDHFQKLDAPIENEQYVETTYDRDATLLQRTFVETPEVDCNYGNRCIGSKLGKRDIVECGMDGCENFGHTKCLRYYRDFKSNEETREAKFFCVTCTKGSCLALV